MTFRMKDHLPGGLIVSTVSLPDAGVLFLGPPYETVVFRDGDLDDPSEPPALDLVRSETWGDAMAAHLRMIQKWKAQPLSLTTTAAHQQERK